ncbi:TetR/AcrR family transcriptional regulator [Thalassospira sp.]|uniref:TetR/AcrR family transcriptional regulator n=1 Tax=Thalassospira sp. TaxID=1912094 RepID=UPI003AA94FBB
MARPSSFDREDALANARNLFWRKGFHATSLKDIEAALSLKPGSIYAAFGSKKDLFAEALKFYSAGVEEEFRDFMAQSRSPLSGLIGYVRSITASGATKMPSNACMVFKTALEMANEEPDLKELAARQLSNVADLFAETFDAARKAGEIAPDTDPHRAALKLQTSITGLRGMIESGLARDDVENLIDDIVSDIERLRVPTQNGV